VLGQDANFALCDIAVTSRNTGKHLAVHISNALYDLHVTGEEIQRRKEFRYAVRAIGLHNLFGLLVFPAHKPKVVSSNLPPATMGAKGKPLSAHFSYSYRNLFSNDSVHLTVTPLNLFPISQIGNRLGTDYYRHRSSVPVPLQLHVRPPQMCACKCLRSSGLWSAQGTSAPVSDFRSAR
jgi:hypothetical protein